MRIKKSPKVVVAASIALVMAGGVAFAYWTATGSGSGAETTASGPVAVEIIQRSIADVGMSPGSAAIPLSGDFINPNTTPTVIHGITATIGTVENLLNADPSACAPSNFAIGGTVLYSSPVPVGGNTTTGVGSWSGLNIRMLESNTNQDACKDVRVNVLYTLVP